MKVVIIDYKAGNVRSVDFALKRLGVESTLSSNADEIKSADKIIFPGVGHAYSAMEQLTKAGLDKLIPKLTQPVIGICLGMQLLCRHTEEGDTKGLGVFDVNVKEFDSSKGKAPHMGWNTTRDLKSPLYEGVDENAQFYYVHSYYAEKSDFTIATCDYILPFSASLQYKNFYAAQFHPEKSAEVGEQVLKNFLSL